LVLRTRHSKVSAARRLDARRFGCRGRPGRSSRGGAALHPSV